VRQKLWSVKESHCVFRSTLKVDLTWAQLESPFQVELEGVRPQFSIQPQEVRFREFFFDANQNFLMCGLGAWKGKVNSGNPHRRRLRGLFHSLKWLQMKNSKSELEINKCHSRSVYDQSESALARKSSEHNSISMDLKTHDDSFPISKRRPFGELIAVESNGFLCRSKAMVSSLEGTIFCSRKTCLWCRKRDSWFSRISTSTESGNARSANRIGLKAKNSRIIERGAVFRPLASLIDRESMG